MTRATFSTAEQYGRINRTIAHYISKNSCGVALEPAA